MIENSVTHPTSIELIATVLFALAILHTFLCSRFQKLGHQFPEGSVAENVFHLLGEVEVVFGIWAGFFIAFYMATVGVKDAVQYLEARNFTEPLFVFVIMTVCASRPILELAGKIIKSCGRLLPLQQSLGFYVATMVVGPLLGSFITEPAAMTVTALILFRQFYSSSISTQLKYATLGLLFVNISIGGTLTPFAAPPVLMVAGKWGWDLQFMLTNFGWKAAIAILISTAIISYRFRKEISSVNLKTTEEKNQLQTPPWVVVLHVVILNLIVMSAHHTVLFMGLFMLFLGVSTVTKEYQDELRIREALLVAFFLGGLVILGGLQAWWIEPILTKLSALPLYLGAMGLTAFTDNAALTYLGSLIPNLSESSKYALVAGSVVGGGLTVIANAPNPAGYSTLNPAFGTDGINAFSLFKSALVPTAVSALCLWLL